MVNDFDISNKGCSWKYEMNKQHDKPLVQGKT